MIVCASDSVPKWKSDCAALPAITYIDGRPKDYRLTPAAPVERSSAHEYADYFRDRCGLHFGGAIVARHGVAARECLVGKSNPDQLDSARHYRACRSNLESLAGSRVDPSAKRPLQRLVLSCNHVFLLHVRLLLV